MDRRRTTDSLTTCRTHLRPVRLLFLWTGLLACVSSCGPKEEVKARGLFLDRTDAIMYPGMEIALTPRFVPENTTGRTLGWYSSDPDIATVTTDGRVTAVAAGTATVTALTLDGSNRSADLAVRVYPTPEPEAVDVGLGILWASWNIGATAPEEFGEYFAWGELEPKSRYEWNNYSFGHSGVSLSKYNQGPEVLDPEDDIAHVVLGGEWRMPTKQEVDDLFHSAIIRRFTCEQTTVNGVKGWKFTSKIKGYEGNWLFFPNSSWQEGDYCQVDKSGSINGSFWMAESSEDQGRAFAALYSEGGPGYSRLQRCYGAPVRPVRNK